MTVVNLTVDSFKRLRAAQLEPSPTGLVPVRGRNAQGKSSLIEAMLAALLGKKAAPPLPITEGAHKAEVVLDLGELVVKRKWTRDSGGNAKAALTVTNRDGGKVSSPQAILDNLVGRFADPVAFLAMKPAEQVKTVLAVTGMDVELEKLEAEEARVFDLRKEAKRDADKAKKHADAMIEELRELAERVQVTDELLALDLSTLVEELRSAEAANAARAQAEASCREEEAHGRSCAERVQRLKLELGDAEEQLIESRAAWKRLREGADALPEVDPEPIREKLRAVESAQEVRQLDARTKEAARDAGEAAEVAALREDEVAGVRQRIAKLLADADFPVQAMTYDAEAKKLLVGGIPFEQASQAEQLRAAAAVAMAGDPQIRVLFAREGSLLDADSQRLLAELAEERGFQLWLEVVDDDPHGAGVWIEDGEAYAAETFAVTPREEVAE